MKIRIIILTILIGGCGTSSKVIIENTITENYKDVFILSDLIGDHMRKSNERNVNLNSLLQNDTLKRISNSFEKIELELRGGHITVYYKFSESRNVSRIELNDQEKERIKKLKWFVKDSHGLYDGEIQFDYGERFYRIKKIII